MEIIEAKITKSGLVNLPQEVISQLLLRPGDTVVFRQATGKDEFYLTRKEGVMTDEKVNQTVMRVSKHS